MKYSYKEGNHVSNLKETSTGWVTELLVYNKCAQQLYNKAFY